MNNHLLVILLNYEGRSKRFATQYDAQMTQAKFLFYYSTLSPLTQMHMLHLSTALLCQSNRIIVACSPGTTQRPV